MTRKFFTAVGFIFLATPSVMAWDSSRCASFVDDGLYTKYKYMGPGEGFTKASKDQGSVKGFSAPSTEGSTASLDPKYSSHQSSSLGQYLSSTGPCAMIGLNEMKERREKYFVQNKDEILREIAKGQGEHLNVLATYSLCEKQSFNQFSQKLQQNMDQFLNRKESYGEVIDTSVKSDQHLVDACYDLSAT
jgi:hypothetical protein